ncbi:glycosyl transferase [Brucella sp. 10RB9213]|uniref:glycosyl transferase n=1 Tax=Brucella sp. 10RB9213 TaxID=1844039 RepID=UPI0012AD7E1C|nr:glycosyl transferase [Brucella sp. 10RB9213]MRN67109.1 glycosyl transferase [Brucella sp. 10RB9213]
MKNLIFISPVPWASFAQRPHKFVFWFHKRHGGRVLWLEPYGTRFPSWKDLSHTRKAIPIESANSIPDWLTVCPVRHLPLEPIPGSGWLNGCLWWSAIRDAVNFANHGECIIAVGKPSVFSLGVLKALPNCVSIYDAMDNFPAFYSGISRLSMRRREQKIVAQVDKVWASSTLLYERWSHQHNNVRLIRNGLDPDTMASVNPVTKTSKQAIFGYMGTIGKWFDWEMVFTLAKAVPEDIVRIVGPLHKAPPDTLPNNIEMLPPCAHSNAIGHISRFDVGLIPFMKNTLTDSVDPIKYYEYRALRIPVLSSDFGEMRYRKQENGVYLVSELKEIENATKAIRREVSNRSIDFAFMDANSWSTRFDQGDIV